MFAADAWAILVPLIAAVGIVLLAIGIGRIRLRWLAVGAVLLAVAALLALLRDDEPWTSVEVVTLRVRAVDAASGRPQRPGRVQIGRPGSEPTSVSTIGPDGLATVSSPIEIRGRGSLGQRLRQQHPLVELGPDQLEVFAEGYQPWRMPLARLLPRDWPLVPPPDVIEIRLERAMTNSAER